MPKESQRWAHRGTADATTQPAQASAAFGERPEQWAALQEPHCYFNDTFAVLAHWNHQILFQFAVGHRVGCHPQLLRRVCKRYGKLAEGHASAQFVSGLLEGGGFAQRS